MPRKSQTMPQMKIAPISSDKNLPAIVQQRPSFLDTMKEGIGLGIGSSIGHRIVGAIMGSPQITPVEVQYRNYEYEECMKDTNDKAGCEYILKK